MYSVPRVTLSDVASLLSQNPTQLSTTMSVQGTYTCNIIKKIVCNMYENLLVFLHQIFTKYLDVTSFDQDVSFSVPV